MIKINQDFNRLEYQKTLKLLKEKNLITVCIEANCPNRYECFSKKSATFMILGDICTRNCKYCNVKHGKPNQFNKEVYQEENNKIIQTIKDLKLKYVVITCVTRDDLEDQGIEQFLDLIDKIKEHDKKILIEILISDLNIRLPIPRQQESKIKEYGIDNNDDSIYISKIKNNEKIINKQKEISGKQKLIEKIANSKAEVINHNIETTNNLFKNLRAQGNYKESLNLLKQIKEINPDKIIKSGLMVGFGESIEDIKETLKDLKESNVDIVTVGQYLQPTKKHYPIQKEYSKEEFQKIKEFAKKIGIKHIEAGSLVRSSYKAKESYEEVENNKQLI